MGSKFQPQLLTFNTVALPFKGREDFLNKILLSSVILSLSKEEEDPQGNGLR